MSAPPDQAAPLREVHHLDEVFALTGEKGDRATFIRPFRLTEKLASFMRQNFTEEVSGRPIIDESRLCSRDFMEALMMCYIWRHRLSGAKYNLIVPNQALQDLFAEDWVPTGVSSEGFSRAELRKLLGCHFESTTIVGQPSDLTLQVELQRYFKGVSSTYFSK